MIKRREFIKKSVTGTAGIAIGGIGFSAKSYASIIGSNERINLAVIGIRNQGTVHIKSFCGLKDSHNVVIKTLCDPDELLFAPASKIVTQLTGVKPRTEWDLRRVYDDKDIHAVSIVTPNHWHALATVWACQAGKHVYVEKPASHNIWEGRKMVEAARKYNLRVQVGLNNRSSSDVTEAMKFLHDGGIGEIYMARALCFKARDSYGMAKNSTPPATFHYDQWLGPAPYRTYNVKRSHYCWHWYWDTGNGDTGNTGPHQLDLARWGMNKNEHPVTVYSAGGIYGLRKEEGPRTPGTMVYGRVETYGRDKTTQETPNTQTAVFKYPDGKMLEFECRGRYTNHEGSEGQAVGNLFYGTEGWLEISGSTWKAFRGREGKPFAGSKEGTRGRDGNLWANFIEAVHSGNNEDLQCDIREGFYSTTLPHLANISYRTGRILKFMGEYERFADGIYRNPYIVPDQV
jgi:predicted dehydrogenase